tara:strand:+ start:6128 stop:6373 length:246 start_codon:yes stop_codon:yes gene_type:complete
MPNRKTRETRISREQSTGVADDAAGPNPPKSFNDKYLANKKRNEMKKKAPRAIVIKNAGKTVKKKKATQAPKAPKATKAGY